MSKKFYNFSPSSCQKKICSSIYSLFYAWWNGLIYYFFYPSIFNIHMNLLLYLQVSIIHEFRIFIWDYLQSIGTRTTFIWSPCVQNWDFILREIFLCWWCKKNYIFSWIVYSNSGFVADVDMVRYAWVIN